MKVTQVDRKADGTVVTTITEGPGAHSMIKVLPLQYKKADFFSASEKDSVSRITVKADQILTSPPKQGDLFILDLQYKDVKCRVLFECNREGKTLKTTSWPQGFPVISGPGLTLNANVLNVTKI